jgi:hypothetical protein
MNSSTSPSLARESRLWLRMGLLLALVLSLLPAVPAAAAEVIVGSGGFPAPEPDWPVRSLMQRPGTRSLSSVRISILRIPSKLQRT